MIHKVKSKKGPGYSAVNPTIAGAFKSQLQAIVKKELERYKDCSQAQYNPVGTLDNVVEKNKVKSVKTIVTLKNALDNPLQKFGFNNNSFNFLFMNFLIKKRIVMRQNHY